MNNVTAIVISFLRPGYTKACIESLRANYGDIKILVGENGEESADMRAFCQSHNVGYIPLPYDSGVCVARNRLVNLVDTDYVLVGDDDFYYTPSARLEQMKAFLDARTEFDLIGGRVSVQGVTKNYQGMIDLLPDHIRVMPLDPEAGERDEVSGLRFAPADLTFNYFLARTEVVRRVPWDEQIKVAYEHLSWFIDLKLAGGKVAYTPDAVVVHKPDFVDPQQSEEYSVFRHRREDKARFFERHKIEYILDINGYQDFAPEYGKQTQS